MRLVYFHFKIHFVESIYQQEEGSNIKKKTWEEMTNWHGEIERVLQNKKKKQAFKKAPTAQKKIRENFPLLCCNKAHCSWEKTLTTDKIYKGARKTGLSSSAFYPSWEPLKSGSSCKKVLKISSNGNPGMMTSPRTRRKNPFKNILTAEFYFSIQPKVKNSGWGLWQHWENNDAN